jgi:hypothetical protein
MTSSARRFVLHRHEDETGVSGTGTVAEGIEFTDGTIALRWLTAVACTGIYPSIHAVEVVHGHHGKTTIEWRD